jgi:pyrroloquinoline quinone (PQQ) biosynthesis protein C
MTQVLTAPGTGLTVSEHLEERLHRGELTQRQVDEFRQFLADVDRELMNHRIIKHNPYTRWFQKGEATDAELKHFIKQFSVFSNQFLVAALLKVINAPSLEQMRTSKEILMNELGVVYRKPTQNVTAGNGSRSDEQKDLEGDPELVNIEGTVDGSIYRHRAAHYEWLLGVGEPLGLGYDDLGKRRVGRPSTLHFCDELQRTYGSEDPWVAEGASFAVENWAAAGFWQEIEDGLLKIKKARIPSLRLAFFTWHNRVEGQHAGHVMDELEEAFFNPHFDREKFFQGGREILEAVAAFWDGLEQDRVNKVVG